MASGIVLLALVATAAGCGGGGGSSSGTTTNAESGPRVGLVTDIGGLNDRSFNHLAYVGLQRAESRLGVQGRVLTSKANSDYVPNLSTLARDKYDLVIGVGFLMADAIDTVAKKYPNVNFAIIDYRWEDLKDKPDNVVGLVFKEQQAGYLVGYLAGLVEKQPGMPRLKEGSVVSSVGGQQIPPVDGYIVGYQAGAKAANKGITTLNQYSNDFVDQAKCKEIALQQIARGSDIVFQVAGGCGLGALDAARGRGVWGIGVDADQSYLGPQILTSALKKVDVAVFQTAKDVKDGSFQGGRSVVFDLSNGGVGIGKISSKVPASITSKVKQVQQRIASGEVDVPGA